MSDKKWEPEPYDGPDNWLRQNGLAGQRVVQYQDEWIAYDGYGSWSYYDTELKAQHLVNYWGGSGCSYCFAPDFDGRECKLRGWVSFHGVRTVEEADGIHQHYQCKCGWTSSQFLAPVDCRYGPDAHRAQEEEYAHMEQVGWYSDGEYRKQEA